MPWCPLCKNEYKEGYTHCSDCDVDLVESLEVAPKAIIFGEQIAIENMCSVLADNHMENCFTHYDESSKQYELYVPYDQNENAKRILQVYLQEMARQQMEDRAQEAEEESAPSHTYEDKHQKAEEYKSSAFALILVGGVGLAAVVLLLLDVLPIHLYGNSKILIGAVMSLMFAGFILLGISSARQYKTGLMIAGKEDELIAKIRAFAAENLTKEKIDSMAGVTSHDVDEMQNYYQRTRVMKSQIEEVFHPNSSLLEKIVDDLYAEIFEA